MDKVHHSLPKNPFGCPKTHYGSGVIRQSPLQGRVKKSASLLFLAAHLSHLSPGGRGRLASIASKSGEGDRESLAPSPGSQQSCSPTSPRMRGEVKVARLERSESRGDPQACTLLPDFAFAQSGLLASGHVLSGVSCGPGIGWRGVRGNLVPNRIVNHTQFRDSSVGPPCPWIYLIYAKLNPIRFDRWVYRKCLFTSAIFKRDFFRFALRK